MEAFWITVGVVFVAELGDKTQLVALSLGARYRIAPVLLGVAIAQTVAMGLSVLAGGALGAALPDRIVGVGAAFAFFAFAAWTLRRPDEPGEDDLRARAGRLVVLTVAIAVFIAELGDKTMLAVATLATRQDLLWTWLGATIGVIASGAVAIVVGHVLGSRLPDLPVRRGAAALFVFFGVLLLADAIRG